MTVLADRLRYRRKQLGMSQVELAQKIERSQARVSEWEKGETQPQADTIVALAKALRVSADWLLGLSDDDSPVHYG